MRRSAWLASAPPAVAIEIASRRVTVVGVQPAAAGPIVSGHATEPLSAGVVVPALAGANILEPAAVSAALRLALDRAGLGSIRRAALVVPDSVARVALLPFDEIPARPGDLDELIRWQVRKATPFAIDDAQLTYFPAHTEDTRTIMAAVVARRDVVSEYETVAADAGVHAGIVDLASFNVMNAIVGTGGAAPGDWLLVHLASEATTLAIMRGDRLMFYRHRTAVDEEPLGALVHQTAMYHEDRLAGGAFERVWLAGDHADATSVRAEIAARLQVPVRTLAIGSNTTARDTAGGASDLVDALAAGVGILIRERVA